MTRRKKTHKRGLFDWLTESTNYSMRKGQFGLFIFSAITIIMILKSSAERIDRLWDEIGVALQTICGLSYLANVLLLYLFYKYSRKLRTRASYEQTRIGKEKSKLQSKLAGHKLGSSD